MFFIIPVGVDYRAQRYPLVTFVLIGINTLVYLISFMVFLSGGMDAEAGIIKALGLTPADLSFHTLFTSTFTHTEFFHLLGNMIYLFLFGACVEDLIGRWKFAFFYLAGGLAADLVHVLVSLASGSGNIPMIGASGAVSASIGGFVLLLGKNKINFRWFFWLVFRLWSGDFWLPAWLVISFWFLKDLFSAALSLVNDATGGGVAFAAHVGGFLGGLAMIGVRRMALARQAHTAPGTGPRPVQHGQSTPVVRAAAPLIFLSDGGAQSGPFSRAQVNDMLARGLVSPRAFYWHEGMADWGNIADLQGPSG